MILLIITRVCQSEMPAYNVHLIEEKYMYQALNCGLHMPGISDMHSLITDTLRNREGDQ